VSNGTVYLVVWREQLVLEDTKKKQFLGPELK